MRLTLKPVNIAWRRRRLEALMRPYVWTDPWNASTAPRSDERPQVEATLPTPTAKPLEPLS